MDRNELIGKYCILLYHKEKEKYMRIAEPRFYSLGGVKRQMFRSRLGDVEKKYDFAKTRFQKVVGFADTGEGLRVVFEEIEGEKLEEMRGW